MSEDEIIKKHTEAVYKSWTNPEKNWFHKLKDLLQEIIIIVFAVTISLWFHNWSEERKDRREEKEFYKGLKEDLLADVKEMMNDRAVLQQALHNTHYFQKTGRGAVPDKDSLMQYSWVFFAQVQINPRIGRFEALKGSGKLDIIENKNTLYNIAELYQKIFPNIYRINQLYNTLTVDRLEPYLSDMIKIDTTGGYANAPEVLRTSKMRILMSILEGDVTNCIAGYTTGIDKSNALIKQIGEESK